MEAGESLFKEKYIVLGDIEISKKENCLKVFSRVRKKQCYWHRYKQ